MFSPVSKSHQYLDTVRQAQPGKVLFLEGDPSTQVFELLHGIVRGVSISPEGERQIAAFFFAGDQIGLPISQDYRFTAEAVTQVSYLRHAASRWQEDLLRRSHDEGRLLPSICAEQDPIFRRGIIIGRSGVQVRICAFLISLIDRLPEADGGLAFPIPQVDIAAYLAISPETACRGFRQLREMGIIAMPRRDRLKLLDRGALEAIASGQLFQSDRQAA